MLLLNKQVITYGDIEFLQSSKVAPFFAELVMIGGGLLLVIQSLVFKKEQFIDISRGELKIAIAIIIVFSLFAAGIYYAGYIIGSLLFVILMFVLNRNKSIPQFIGLCIMAIGIYFLFTSVFSVQLPGFGGINR